MPELAGRHNEEDGINTLGGFEKDLPEIRFFALSSS